MTKVMVGIRDTSVMQGKIIELQGVILSAQSAALSAQSDQLSLLERVRELEKEVAQAKEWNSEKEKYKLVQVGSGSFAYMMKEPECGAGPHHMLCANCFEHGRKSILQLREIKALDKEEIHYCPACKAEFLMMWETY
jgi:hypothetical protein